MIVVDGASPEDKRSIEKLLKELKLKNVFGTFIQPKIDSNNLFPVLEVFFENLFGTHLMGEALVHKEWLDCDFSVSSRFEIYPDFTTPGSTHQPNALSFSEFEGSERYSYEDYKNIAFFTKFFDAKKELRDISVDYSNHLSLSSRQINIIDSFKHNVDPNKLKSLGKYLNNFLSSKGALLTGVVGDRKTIDAFEENINKTSTKKVSIIPPIYLRSPNSFIDQDNPTPYILGISIGSEDISFFTDFSEMKVERIFKQLMSDIKNAIRKGDNFVDIIDIFS